MADSKILSQRVRLSSEGANYRVSLDADGDHAAGFHDDAPHPDCSHCVLPKVRVRGFDRLFKRLGEVLND